MLGKNTLNLPWGGFSYL